jgi:exocyst complex protein 7
MIQTLTTLSQSHKRPPLASIFLLNNISTLRLHLLANPSSSIDELLSKPTREALNSAFRSSKADYFSANFGPLSNALVEEKEASGLAGVVGAVGVGPSSKSLLKERWMRYWEVLEEIVERHRFARIMGDDEEGRGLLADEAVKMVIPQLERFMAKNREKDFTKNVGKCECLSQLSNRR